MFVVFSQPTFPSKSTYINLLGWTHKILGEPQRILTNFTAWESNNYIGKLGDIS